MERELQFFDVHLDSKIMVESLHPVSAGALKRLGADISPERVLELASETRPASIAPEGVAERTVADYAVCERFLWWCLDRAGGRLPAPDQVLQAVRRLRKSARRNGPPRQPLGLEAERARSTRLATARLSVGGCHTRTLDSHASRLRRKLDPEAARLINCWGVAYQHLFGPIPLGGARSAGAQSN